MILKKINQILPKEIKIGLGILYVLMILAAFLELISLGLIPLFISYVVSENINNFFLNFNIDYFLNFIPGSNITFKLSFLLFFVFLIKFFYMIFYSYYELSIIKKIKLFFSLNIYSAYTNKEYNFFLKRNTSELGRNIINETENAVFFLACILSISKEIFLIFVIGFLLIIYDPLITLIGILVVSLFVLIFYLKTDRKLKDIAEVRVKLFGDLFKHVIETFSIIKEIKVYSKENSFIKKFINLRTELEVYLFKRNFLVKLPKIVFEFLAVSLIIILIVIFTLMNKNMGELFTLLSLLAVAVVRLLPSFNTMSLSLTNFASYKISFEILSKDIERFQLKENLKNKSNKINNNLSIDEDQTEVQFDKVNFNYEANKNVGINNVSFKIKKGEMIGIIGKSGAGKSTLVNIMLKLLKPDNGKVLFRDQTSPCGYVPQDIYLLDSSLKTNIVFGQDEKNIDEKKLIDVIKKCELSNFINTHKKGVDLILGERGIRISGGEKQRIGLARTLYSGKKIIILDEATSALDNQTEKSIMNSILKLKNDLTIVIVAHRLSTLQYCDRIFYLEKGFIKDEGKLEYLLSKYPDLNIDKNNNN